jgi:hypothetical protein
MLDFGRLLFGMYLWGEYCMTTETNFGVQINKTSQKLQIGDYIQDHPENLSTVLLDARVYYNEWAKTVTILYNTIKKRYGSLASTDLIVYHNVVSFVNLGDGNYLMFIHGEQFAKILIFQ